MHEIMKELFSKSKLLTLDLNNIPDGTPANENIALFFNECLSNKINPRLPENRQSFNNSILSKGKYRYLLGAQGEDRYSMLKGSAIAKEGRTIHLGIDIFCKDLEDIYAPCDGIIVRIGKEQENHSYGNYLIFKPKNTTIPYMFLGHLGEKNITTGYVKSGEKIAEIGDFINFENGGWSRHLHLQMLSKLPPVGHTPIGYSSKKDIVTNLRLYPSPFNYFTNWYIAGQQTQELP